MATDRSVLFFERITDHYFHEHQLFFRPDQLMDHDAERRKNPGEWSMFQKEVVDVVKTVRQDVDDDLVHKLIGILNTNSVSFNFKKDSRK